MPRFDKLRKGICHSVIPKGSVDAVCVRFTSRYGDTVDVVVAGRDMTQNLEIEERCDLICARVQAAVEKMKAQIGRRYRSSK